MAKFEEIFPDFEALFVNLIDQIDNLREVNIKILANNKLKEIGKVVKANDLLKHMTNEDIIILVNEKIFEQLVPEQQQIVIEELVARIYFNAEKGNIQIIQPDVNTYSLLLRKYGYDKYEELHLCIKSLFSKEGAEDAENNQ